jgi:hypothetical protein
LEGLSGMKRFWRASGRLYLAFLVLALVSFIGSLLIDAFKRTLIPFPTFGGTFTRVEGWIGVAALVLWASAIVNVYRAVVASPAATEESTGTKAVMLFSFVAGLLALCGWIVSTTALPVYNALLDLSPLTSTPVLVHNASERSFSTFKYGTGHDRLAVVSRLDHPDERVTIDWKGCPIPSFRDTSPFATLRLGRGAIGVPWISLPIECHPLAISDKPLFGGTFLGKGGPVVLAIIEFDDPETEANLTRAVTAALTRFDAIASGGSDAFRSSVEDTIAGAAILGSDIEQQLRAIWDPVFGGPPGADAKAAARCSRELIQTRTVKMDRAHVFGLWEQKVDAVAPDVPIVVIYQGDPGKHLPEYRCPRCTVLSAEAVDPDVFRVFTGSAGLGFGEPRVLLADAAGRRTFEAPLLDTAQIAKFAQRLGAAIGGSH